MDKYISFLDQLAGNDSYWQERTHSYYHNELNRYIQLMIPQHSRVLEVGCELGDRLNALNPQFGMGVEFSEKMVQRASELYRQHTFIHDDGQFIFDAEPFDYILISNALMYFEDIQKVVARLRTFCHNRTKIIVIPYNKVWQPILKTAENMGKRLKWPPGHWLGVRDIQNLFELEGFDLVTKQGCFLWPIQTPVVSTVMNRFLAQLPLIRHFVLNSIMVFRPGTMKGDESQVSCSVIIPCRNEKGNIEDAVKRLPQMGRHMEILFVEGHSSDGTLEECERVKSLYSDKNISVMVQNGKGKGDAVRQGFYEAKGDVLMILDADLTVPPEDLPKFFSAIVQGRGDFINGSRLVYKMEQKAMRFLNMCGNKFFSIALTYVLGQYLKDTLCGTKVLWRADYQCIATNREYFGDFDPFGDFDLLFGAAKLNLKIVEIPIRYRERTYGETQIRRFAHGWLLLKMTVFAMRKIKFI